MRWFVEVSRVGETRSDEKYCVEAKQWQAALQEARRLRGDSGPLSKFSIELLDDGYRAVDPKLKLRYLVAKAPGDAELTSIPPESEFGSQAPRANGQPAAGASVAPTAAQASVPVAVAVPVTTAPVAAGASVVASPSAVTIAQLEPHAGVPSSALSPVAAVQQNVAAEADRSPSAFPPRPTGSEHPPSAKPPAGLTVPADVIPPAPNLPRGMGAPVAEPPATYILTQPSASLDLPPPSQVLRRRQEEPSGESPITYREVAYVVAPGVTRASVEALLWASFRDISRELSARVGQKFVQLAVFDHTFEKRPERPPLGTLAWKDWRGNPAITFPFFDGTQPARASLLPPSAAPPAPAPRVPGPSSIIPVGVITISSPPAAPAVAATTPVAAPPLEGVPPTLATPPMPSSVVAAVASVAPPEVAVAAPLLAPAEPEVSAPIPLTREKAATSVATQATAPKERASRPRQAAVRRRAGEDLIGELFETMHDLHFMSGVGDGAEFVMEALESIVPCEGVLIHVFDINKRQFVVVRAKGTTAAQTLLLRTPDTEGFFDFVMHRPGSIAFEDVGKEPRLLGERWHMLGVKPSRALCGPVRQGGRYLGLVEVANPLGEAPFHQTEQNAIDYVCQQFAEFLANRPIVLDPEVVLRR